MNICQFITFYIKLQHLQNPCVLGSIKFGYRLLDKICDKIKCLISKKSGITN